MRVCQPRRSLSEGGSPPRAERNSFQITARVFICGNVSARASTLIGSLDLACLSISSLAQTRQPEDNNCQ